MSWPDSRRVSVPKDIIDDAGREALLAVVAIRDEGATAVVSLEGLGPGQVELFPYGPPFFCEETAALAALRDVSNARPWLVRVSTS